MFGISDYPTFVGAVILFLAIPGPGNLALLTSTAQAGLRGGLVAALGIMAGDQVLMWAAVAGCRPCCWPARCGSASSNGWVRSI